jgi:hypothetical protein
MVQSKGTRWESHLFKIDRTGMEKYSGRSTEVRQLSAGGDKAARRAMPTSGARAPAAAKAASHRERAKRRSSGPCMAEAGGGQSAASAFEVQLPGPTSGAGSSDRMFGLCSGSWGKRETADGRTWRRRAGKPTANGEEWEERTGDIAHLVAVESISLFIRFVKNYLSLFIR